LSSSPHTSGFNPAAASAGASEVRVQQPSLLRDAQGHPDLKSAEKTSGENKQGKG